MPSSHAPGLSPEDTARELSRRVATLPRLDASPLPLPGDPWARRLLVALADHLPRQRWVGTVVETLLHGRGDLLASDGALGHPDDIPQHGPVPTLEGWTYFFHGRGCCLTHTDGTTIDVDFDESGADGIDPYFYSHYLDTLPTCTGIEALVRLPRPFSEGWMADLATLRALEFIDDDHRFHLTELGLRWADALGPFVREMASAAPERQRQLALILGDFLVARASGPLADDAVLWASDSVMARLARLEAMVYEERSHHALQALAALGRTWAAEAVARILANKHLDGLTSCALDLIAAWQEPGFEQALLVLASRATSREAPHPYLRVRSLELVFSAYRADTVPDAIRASALDVLRADAHASEAEAAFFVYLLEPSEGLARLARALHHDVPFARYEAAACLAMLGTAEAIEALRAADNQEAQTALALLRGAEPEPGPEPVGRFIEWRGRPRKVYRMDELMVADAPNRVASLVNEMNERFGPLLARWWAS